MAVSKVGICNLALSKAGTKSTISSFTEDSNEARQCALVYDDAVDFVLRKHTWGFAQKRVILADLGTPPTGWCYRYAYPDDCINAGNIVVPDKINSNVIPFKEGVNADKTIKEIHTDTEAAELQYTARVTTVALYDAMFVESLAWYIAHLITTSLTGRDGLKELNMFKLSVAEAVTYDSNEGEELPKREPDSIRARS